MATAQEFREELHKRFREAQSDGLGFVDVIARDLHAAAQRITPTRTPRLPNCCSIMRQEQKPGTDELISEKASDGPDFAIRYRLPR